MYVIAGCYGKYRCHNDIFTLDLAPLLNSGDTSKLKWAEKSAAGIQLLPRWGHSLAVYNDRIYIFGGRFSNDLNDVLVYHPESNAIKMLKTGG